MSSAATSVAANIAKASAEKAIAAATTASLQEAVAPTAAATIAKTSATILAQAQAKTTVSAAAAATATATATAGISTSSSVYSFSSYPFEVFNIMIAVVLMSFLMEAILKCLPGRHTITLPVFRNRVASVMAALICTVLLVLISFCSDIAENIYPFSESVLSTLTTASWLLSLWCIYDLYYRYVGFLSLQCFHHIWVLFMVQGLAAASYDSELAVFDQALLWVIILCGLDIFLHVSALLISYRTGKTACKVLTTMHVLKTVAMFGWMWSIFSEFSTATTWGMFWAYLFPIAGSVLSLANLYLPFKWLETDFADEMAVEEDEDGVYKHPMETCSSVEQMTLCWMEPMLWTGSQRTLQLEDVYDMPYSSRSAAINIRFDEAWANEEARVEKLQRNDPEGEYSLSLMRVLLNAYGRFKYIIPFQAVGVVTTVLSPIIVYLLLIYVTYEYTDVGAYVDCLLLFTCIAISSFSTGQAFHYCNHMAVNCQSACMNAVYRKLFRLSTSTIQKAGSSMVNMLSGDAQRVYLMFYSLAHMTNITATLFAGFLLFYFLGYAGFIAIGMVVLVVPFQFWLGHNMHMIRASMMSASDQRIQQTSEFLSGVRLIKMQGWESHFKDKISAKRSEELHHLWRLFRFRITNSTVSFALPTFVSTAVFVGYVFLFGEELTIATTFASLAVLSSMRPGFFLLPIVMISFAEGTVAISRFTKFLTLEEMPDPRGQQGDDGAFPHHYVDGDDMDMDGDHPGDHHVRISNNNNGTNVLVGGGRFMSVEHFDEIIVPEADLQLERPPLRNKQIPISIENGEFMYYEAGELQDICKEAGGPVGPPTGNLLDEVDFTPEEDPLIDQHDMDHKEDYERLHMTNVNLRVNKGDLVCIVGAVGAGKSSLVRGILGELKQLSGTRSLNGRIAYAGQNIWILNDTIRNNILFNMPYDEGLYFSVLEAAQLLPDLTIMPAGDLTVVGERGVTLSGGQKARISLCRLLYRAQYSDVFVLDDLLAALDMQTLKAVLELGILGLLHNKTRVVVMNSNYYGVLETADQVVIMENGQVAAVGSYDELIGDFASVLCKNEHEVDANDDTVDGTAAATTATTGTATATNAGADASTASASGDDNNDMSDDDVDANDMDIDLSKHESKSKSKTLSPRPSSSSASFSSSASSSSHGKKLLDNDEEYMHDVADPAAIKKKIAAAMMGLAGDLSEAARSKKGRLAVEEARVVGILDLGLYNLYFGSAWGVSGYLTFALVVTLVTLAQACQTASDYWLAEWAEDSSSDTDAYYAMYFGILLGITIVFSWAKAQFFMMTAWRSGKKMHERALDRLCKAPVHLYFDVVPTGRILNRFSKDMDAVDLLLVDFFFEFLETAFFIFFLALVCAYSVPEILVVFVPLCYLFYQCRQIFSRSSREIKRIESVSRSPVFSIFGETVSGLGHIRAYGEEESFRKKYYDRLDTHIKTTFHLNEITPWNVVRLDLIGAFMVLTVTICILWFQDSISETLAALALSYSTQLQSRLTECVWKSIETENYMTQMERLEHFQHIPQENYGEGDDVPANWPKHGKVMFDRVHFRYRPDLNNVLHGVNFLAQPAEHLGICGRTGSGKSSLMVVMFRLGEIAQGQGNIYIDDVDIGQIRLDDLRSRISIIPQMPWLFKGTVRENLDPSGIRSDAELWEALRHAHLADWVQKSELKLETAIVERGANMSQGQRQLLCIARALVRRSKVVMMDEATANIDHATDALIQETIRKHFNDCTTLTIAHRLTTIANSDRILVLSHGRVVECASPHQLLQNDESDVGFAALVRELAPESVDVIAEIAAETEQERGQRMRVAMMR